MEHKYIYRKSRVCDIHTHILYEEPKLLEGEFIYPFVLFQQIKKHLTVFFCIFEEWEYEQVHRY